MLTATAIARPYEQTWNRQHAVQERELSTRRFRTFADAVAWLDRNLDSWRGALEEHEACVETWVHGPRGRVDLHARHGRDVGANEVLFVRTEGRSG